MKVIYRAAEQVLYLDNDSQDEGRRCNNDGSDLFTAELAHRPPIKRVCIDNVEFSWPLCNQLCAVLSPTLTSFMYSNEMPENNPVQSAACLISIILSCSNLTSIDIRHTDLSSWNLYLLRQNRVREFAIRLNLLAQIVFDNCNLPMLFIQSLLKSGFLNPTTCLLLHFEIYDDNLTPQVLQKLVKQLSNNLYIKRIFLSSLQIQTEQAIYLMQSLLQSNPFLEQATIKGDHPAEELDEPTDVLFDNYERTVRSHHSLTSVANESEYGFFGDEGDDEIGMLDRLAINNTQKQARLQAKMNLMSGVHSVMQYFGRKLPIELWGIIIGFALHSRAYHMPNLPTKFCTPILPGEMYRPERDCRYLGQAVYPQPLVLRYAKSLHNILIENSSLLPAPIQTLIGFSILLYLESQDDEVEHNRTSIQICYMLFSFLKRIRAMSAEERAIININQDLLEILCTILFIVETNLNVITKNLFIEDALEQLVAILTGKNSDLSKSSKSEGNQEVSAASAAHPTFVLDNLILGQPFQIPEAMINAVSPGQTIIVNGQHFRIREIGVIEPSHNNSQGKSYWAFPRYMGG